MPRVRTANTEELDRVLHTVTLAFSQDPLMRWMLPRADNYLQGFGPIIKAFCGESVVNDATYVTEDFGGAALWLPPGLGPDEEAMGELAVKYMNPEILEDFGELMGQMDHYHPHDEPCWYLAVIGADSYHQGKGIGSALMKHATRMLDESSMLSYLESSNPANISLYQRHGFEIMGEIRAGSAPLVTPMIRHPQ